MSKKFLFRKFNWYIGRKMTSLLSDHFWLRYFACITPVNPHSSPRGVVLLLPLYKERYLSEASITWRWPGYSTRDPPRFKLSWACLQCSWKKEMCLVHVPGEISLIFVPQVTACTTACTTSPLLKPTKCYTQGLSQMS